jgi:hypothetical protein
VVVYYPLLKMNVCYGLKEERIWTWRDQWMINWCSDDENTWRTIEDSLCDAAAVLQRISAPLKTTPFSTHRCFIAPVSRVVVLSLFIVLFMSPVVRLCVLLESSLVIELYNDHSSA